jgi:hypothetical protein
VIVNMDGASARSPGNTAYREPLFIASSTSKEPLFQKGSEIATYKLLKTNSRIFAIRLFHKVWVKAQLRNADSTQPTALYDGPRGNRTVLISPYGAGLVVTICMDWRSAHTLEPWVSVPEVAMVNACTLPPAP